MKIQSSFLQDLVYLKLSPLMVHLCELWLNVFAFSFSVIFRRKITRQYLVMFSIYITVCLTFHISHRQCNYWIQCCVHCPGLCPVGATNTRHYLCCLPLTVFCETFHCGVQRINSTSMQFFGLCEFSHFFPRLKRTKRHHDTTTVNNGGY